MRPSLRGRVVAITGASSGIGAATAVECARAGMDVALGARRVEKLGEVARRVEALGRRAAVVPCDVDRDADVDAFVERAVAELGRLDAVFANAGYGLFAPVLETSDAQARAIFETNFFGTLRLIRAAVPVLRRNEPRGGLRGHVLICSSAASEVAPPMYGLYAATKAAQDSVAGALRAELAGERIAVTSVHPIGTHTAFFDRAGGAGIPPRALRANTPRMLWQTPERVARRVVRAMGKRRPPPEVWPHAPTRFAVALATAFPGPVAAIMRRQLRGMRGGSSNSSV